MPPACGGPSTVPPAPPTSCLQEFISGGPNEGDLAMVYEASALARQEEASRQRPGGYRLLFPDPTFETVLAAAVLRGQAAGRAEDGERFVAFLRHTGGPGGAGPPWLPRPPAVGGQPGGAGGEAPAGPRASRAGGAAAPLAAGRLSGGPQRCLCRPAPGAGAVPHGRGKTTARSAVLIQAPDPLPPRLVLACDALFLSDLHLGSNQCEAGHLAAFLGCIRPKRLFLVGDIIDLQAIRFNASIDAACLTGLIDDLLEHGGGGLAVR